MLKITEQRTEPGALQVLLEGRLAGQWVEEFTRYLGEVSVDYSKSVTIDLTGVTFIDADGKVLLAQLSQQGAELRASGCMTRCVVEEILRGGRPDPVMKTCDRSWVKADTR